MAVTKMGGRANRSVPPSKRQLSDAVFLHFELFGSSNSSGRRSGEIGCKKDAVMNFFFRASNLYMYQENWSSLGLHQENSIFFVVH
jgi:hypothetical protein